MLGLLMGMAVCGIQTYLILNPNEQDAIDYPAMCWHSHVGVTLPEWQQMLKTSRVPGYDGGTKMAHVEDNAKLHAVYQFRSAGHPGRRLLWACSQLNAPLWLPVHTRSKPGRAKDPRVPFQQLTDNAAGAPNRLAQLRRFESNKTKALGFTGPLLPVRAVTDVAMAEAPPAPAVTEAQPAPAVTEAPPAPAVAEAPRTPAVAGSPPAPAVTEASPAPALLPPSTGQPTMNSGGRPHVPAMSIPATIETAKKPFDELDENEKKNEIAVGWYLLQRIGGARAGAPPVSNVTFARPNGRPVTYIATTTQTKEFTEKRSVQVAAARLKKFVAFRTQKHKNQMVDMLAVLARDDVQAFSEAAGKVGIRVIRRMTPAETRDLMCSSNMTMNQLRKVNSFMIDLHNTPIFAPETEVRASKKNIEQVSTAARAPHHARAYRHNARAIV